MKKFIISLFLVIAGIIIGIITVFIFVIAIVLSFSGSKTVVKNDSYLMLDFSGAIKEKPQPEFPGIFNIGKKSMELLDFIKSIQNASIDERIKGIIINADLSFYDRSHIEEINTALKKFRETGKKIYAWFSNADKSNYFLCIEADEIYMPETNSASLTLQGYSITSPYMKKGLDKLGISFDVIHIGDYKGTGENLNSEAMSKESIKSYTSLYDSIFEKDIETISKRRKIETGEIINFISSGKTIMMTPAEAKSNGFIDGFSTYQDLKDKYVNTVSIYDYSFQIQKNETQNRIAVLYAEGTIYNYSNGTDSFGNDMIGAENFINVIKKIKDDDTIRAVVIRVNSPGGSALASELIFQEIVKLKNKKPVYISMGPLAASGGYYISSAGLKIFTTETTLTGSIGVVTILMNYEMLSKNLGINFESIKKFKYDDIFSSSRKPTPEELTLIRKSNMNVYEEFTGHVIKERKLQKEKIDELAQGRIWAGRQAVKNGLADFIGGLDDAIEYASRTNKINNYSIVSYPKPESFFESLAGINESSSMKMIKDFMNTKEGKSIRIITSLYNYSIGNGKAPSMVLPYYDLP